MVLKRRLQLLGLLVLLCCQTLWAQEKMHLHLRDSVDGTAVADALVTLYRNGRVLSSPLHSDAEGRLTVIWPERSSYLMIRKMGYRPYRVAHKDALDLIEVSLVPQETVLPGVTVTRRPIRMEGDTVTYDALSFIRPEDDTLKDLLKRMPGIEVTKDGLVKYQGEPIKRFYIEGMDLLGGEYNRATTNLTASAISSVDVLEHHQDIKLLRGKVFESKASLNIHIKERYKIHPFGYLKGGGDTRLQHFAGHLSVTRIGQPDRQYMANLKGNTLGQLYETEERAISITGHPITFLTDPAPLLQTDLEGKIPLEDEDYIDNRSLLGSANTLLKTASESTLRIGLSALTERSELGSHHVQLYEGPSPVTIDEESNSSRRIRSLMSTVTYEHNSGRLYIQDRLSYRGQHLNLSRDLLDAALPDRAISIRPTEDQQMVSNLLTGMIPLGSHILSAYSVLRYSDQSGQLGLLLPSPESPLPLRRRELMTRHLLSSNFLLTHTLGLDLELRHDFAQRHFDDGAGRESQSDYRYHHITLDPAMRLLALGETLRITLALPVDYELVTTTMESSPGERLSRPSINPRLSLRYTPTPDYTIFLSLMRTHNASSPYPLFAHQVRSSHRLYSSYPLCPIYRSAWRGSLRQSYKDLLHYIFADLTINGSISEEPLMRSLLISEARSEISYLPHPHTIRRLGVQGEVDKSLLSAGIDIGLSGQYDLSDYINEVNGQTNNGIRHMGNLSLKLVYNSLSWLTLENRLTGSRTWTLPVERPKASFQTLQNSLGLSILPIYQLHLFARYDLTTFPHSRSGLPTIHLLSVGGEYHLSDKWELSLHCTNLLGQEAYIVQTLLPTGEDSLSTPLSPRRLLLSATYHFR